MGNCLQGCCCCLFPRNPYSFSPIVQIYVCLKLPSWAFCLFYDLMLYFPYHATSIKSWYKMNAFRCHWRTVVSSWWLIFAEGQWDTSSFFRVTFIIRFTAPHFFFRNVTGSPSIIRGMLESPILIFIVRNMEYFYFVGINALVPSLPKCNKSRLSTHGGRAS